MIQRIDFTRNYGFLKYFMKILIGHLKAKVDREDILKPAIGNESLHEVGNGDASQRTTTKS